MKASSRKSRSLPRKEADVLEDFRDRFKLLIASKASDEESEKKLNKEFAQWLGLGESFTLVDLIDAIGRKYT